MGSAEDLLVQLQQLMQQEESKTGDIAIPILQSLQVALNTTPATISPADATLLLSLMGHGEAAVAEAAVMAVWQASFHAPSREVLREAGGVQSLRDAILAHVDRAAAAEHAVRALWNLADSPQAVAGVA
eukprot:gene45755-56004_t